MDAAKVPPQLQEIVLKLARFKECADDDNDVDISRGWFDVLTFLGLLERTQRSPATWQITDEGEALLASSAGEAIARRELIDAASCLVRSYEDEYGNATGGLSGPVLLNMRARELRAAIRKATAQSWRPIETAPRDGSYFLAAQFLPGRPVPVFECQAHWFRWANPEGVYRRDAIEHERPLPATHWMPIEETVTDPATAAASQLAMSEQEVRENSQIRDLLTGEPKSRNTEGDVS